MKVRKSKVLSAIIAVAIVAAAAGLTTAVRRAARHDTGAVNQPVPGSESAAAGLHGSRGNRGDIAQSATPSSSDQSGPDIEERARAAHGWSPSILDSTMTGSINYYDRNGDVTRQGAIKILRAYPDQVRAEITSGGKTDIFGYDANNAWRRGSGPLSASDARDARAWARFTPERMFVRRSAGDEYREARPIGQDSTRATPWQPAIQLAAPIILEQAALTDRVGPLVGAAAPGHVQSAADQRSTIFFVNAADSIINSVSWLEPDDPTKALTGPDADLTAVHLDFGKWQRINGVLWPFEIVHWLGGKVDFRIEVTQVQVNSHPGIGLFQHP
jgi:hypothetical protein